MADQEQAPAFTGGPGQETPDQPAAPEANVELVEVTLSGRKVMVHPDVADAIREDSLRRTQDFSRQGEELGRLRREVEIIAAHQQPQPQQTQRDPDLEFYEAPTKALEQRFGQFRQEVINEITQAYRMEQERVAWWNAFYGDNPALRGKDALVQAVLQQEWNNVKDLPGPDGRLALARATYRMLNMKTPDAGNIIDLPNTPARSESPSNTRQTSRQTPQEPEITATNHSASDYLRKRMAARAAGKPLP